MQRSLTLTDTKYPGKTKTRLYSIWEGLVQRCCNPKCKDYYKYGKIGRGLCEEWRDSDIFITWALSNGYSDELSLDRIDNMKGYSPDNCRFATRTQQNSNKLNNRIITYKDYTGTVKDVCAYFNLIEKRVRTRIEHGWTIEDAIELPRCARPKKRIPYKSLRKSFDKDTKELITHDR